MANAGTEAAALEASQQGRDASQRRFLASYAALSFVALFGINLLVQQMAYTRIASLASAPPSGAQRTVTSRDISRWYVQKVQIKVTQDLVYEKPSLKCLLAWSLLILGAGSVVGFTFYIAWPRRVPWKSVVAYLLYALLPIPICRYFCHDMTGLELIAPIFEFLLYTVRRAQGSNPHLELTPPIDQRKFEAILRFYDRQFVLSLGVVALVSTTFVFGLQGAFRELWRTADWLFPAIEWPYFVSFILNCMLGIIGLVGGVTAELSGKIRETMRMPIAKP